MAKIIIKRRVVGDRRGWEDIPDEMHCYVSYDSENPSASFKHFAKEPNIYELRWNWDGSPQGHYISGNPNEREKHLNGG